MKVCSVTLLMPQQLSQTFPKAATWVDKKQQCGENVEDTQHNYGKNATRQVLSAEMHHLKKWLPKITLPELSQEWRHKKRKPYINLLVRR